MGASGGAIAWATPEIEADDWDRRAVSVQRHGSPRDRHGSQVFPLTAPQRIYRP
jgi:hypothetical protein